MQWTDFVQGQLGEFCTAGIWGFGRLGERAFVGASGRRDGEGGGIGQARVRGGDTGDGVARTVFAEPPYPYWIRPYKLKLTNPPLPPMPTPNKKVRTPPPVSALTKKFFPKPKAHPYSVGLPTDLERACLLASAVSNATTRDANVPKSASPTSTCAKRSATSSPPPALLMSV